jgi:1,4-alpha-glucan branching enzyme
MATRPFSADDRWLFNSGEHENLYEVLGAQIGPESVTFRVWAPNAEAISVMGDFNSWDPAAHPMVGSESGVWETTVPGAEKGTIYKYAITPRGGGRLLEKADPFAFHAENPPKSGSIVWDLDYQWEDAGWMAARAAKNGLDAPISVYECHLGSWSRQGPMDYVSLAKGLVEHLQRTGFTHLELMPIMEHPYDGSWGYQSTGYFSPTSRFGTPQQFMAFVDILHQAGIGVILDWVPSHFAVDAHGLARFDGSHLFEHADPRQGYHPDWGSYIFNYGRNEVRSFLISSAHYWFDRYHIDAIRVDAVASMLYLDYSRRDGEWIPNRYGGRENLEAVDFLRRLNASVYGRFPGAQMIAEESTAWPSVTRPTDVGGLGFGFKWDMGWMNDTLRYFALDPIYRQFEDNHRLLTFRGLYAFTENYVLAFSHDEVVHGKRSLLAKNPGDEWQRFAGYRALLGYQWALPGKKLIFMGCEIGSPFEWDHQGEVPFSLLEFPVHAGVMAWVTDLNRLYRDNPALHVDDVRAEGFEWIAADDRVHSVIAFIRRAPAQPPVLVIANFTPEAWPGYRLGVPSGGVWTTLLCSDAARYGGSGVVPGDVVADEHASHGRSHSIELTVPPMSVTLLTPK